MSGEPGGTLTHYTSSPRAAAHCGADWADGRVCPYPDDVTCPRCRALLAATRPPASIRRGVERAGGDLRDVAVNLSVWERRGTFVTHSDQFRRESGTRALGLLDEVIEALTDWRDALSTALRASTPHTTDHPREPGPGANDHAAATRYRPGKGL